MAINVKAQASRLFQGVKSTPVAKGIKDVLYVDGLFNNAQKKAMTQINEKALKGISIKDMELDDEIVDGINIGGFMNDEMKKAIDQNMKDVDKMGLDGITDEKTKKFIENRAKKNPSIEELQKDTILNTAKANLLLDSRADELTSELINRSAKSVDGQLSIMTPFNAAKEYYGTPLANTVNNIKAGEWNDAARNAGIAGARIGATGMAVGATAMAFNGTVGLARTGINKIRGNDYER